MTKDNGRLKVLDFFSANHRNVPGRERAHCMAGLETHRKLANLVPEILGTQNT